MVQFCRYSISNSAVCFIPLLMVSRLGEKEKRNIGLNLRSNRGKGKEAVGYTKRTEGERTEWLYSEALEADLIAYGNEFPRVVDYLYNQFTSDDRKAGFKFSI